MDPIVEPLVLSILGNQSTSPQLILVSRHT